MFQFSRPKKMHRGMLTALLGIGSIAASFSLGMVTTGSIQPVSLIEAGSGQANGDINQNGVLDLDDIRTMLEISRGYREQELHDLVADFDGDGTITVDDAIRALRIVETQ